MSQTLYTHQQLARLSEDSLYQIITDHGWAVPPATVALSDYILDRQSGKSKDIQTSSSGPVLPMGPLADAVQALDHFYQIRDVLQQQLLDLSEPALFGVAEIMGHKVELAGNYIKMDGIDVGDKRALIVMLLLVDKV